MANCRVERMPAAPAGDWTIEDVVALCREYRIRVHASERRRVALEGVRSQPR